MYGHRTYVKRDGQLVTHLEPGDYGWSPINQAWYAMSPNGLLANLKKHEVIENYDETITVWPSILVKDGLGKTWHGYLKNGIWKEC